MSWMRKTLFLVVVLVFSAAVLLAQTEGNTGQIVGTVYDPNGAVVPNVKVMLTNLDTGAVRTLTTNESGQYRAVLLQAGRYKVVAEAPGFATATAGEVVVNVGTAVDVNFTLKLGAVAETVEVSAPLVEVTRSEPGAVINARGILNLPIDGRRFQDLVRIAPTATVEGRRQQISILGQRGIYTSVNLDGLDYNQPFFGGIRGGERSNFAFTVPQESIAEFQVITAGYSAEFGRSSGGVVTAITKSGGNGLHGSAFYYLRHKELGVKTALEQQSLETRHLYGGSLGGPIRKDRMFFFGAAERQNSSTPRAVFFPTLRTNARSAANGEAWDYFKSLEEPFTQTNDATAITGRFDYQFSGGHRFFGRYNHSRNNALNAASVGTALDPLTNNAQSNNGTEQDRTHNVTSQWVALITPNLANELRFQYAREERPRLANAASPTVSATVGTFGSRSFLPTVQRDDRIQISENLNWQRGTHSLKFGFEYNWVNAFQQFGFNQFGAFSISGSDVNQHLALLGKNPSRFDSTLVTYSRQLGNLLLDFSQNEYGFYLQDSWRISPSFTLNLGLRWEGQFLEVPVTNNTDYVNEALKPYPLGSAAPTKAPDLSNQWMPRLGFAWDPKHDGKTVVRGSVGLYYAHTPMLTAAGPANNFRIPPGDLSTSLPFDVSRTPNSSINTVYKQLKLIGIDLNNFTLDKLPILTAEQIQSIPAALGITPFTPFRGTGPTTWAPDFENPRSVQWGFGFEREIKKGISAFANFNYANTVHLLRNRDLNLPPPIIRSTDRSQRPFFGLRSGTARPNTFFGTSAITMRESSARSMYRGASFGARINRQRYQLIAHYTYAATYSDDDSERDAGGFGYNNGFNLKDEYGYSELDARHTLVASGTVNLKWGLEVSNIWRMRSALPFTPSTGADTNEDRGSNDRAFQAPGVAFPRNSFRNLAFYNADLRLLKAFRLWNEQSKLQISAEMFNIFNFSNVSFSGANNALGRNQIYGPGVDPDTGNILGAGFGCLTPTPQQPGIPSQLCAAGKTLVPAATGAGFRRIVDPLTGKVDRNNTVGDPFKFQIGVRLIF